MTCEACLRLAMASREAARLERDREGDAREYFLISTESRVQARSVVYAIGRSPVARGLAASHASISDACQRTARRPTRIGSGNSPSRMNR